MSDDTGILPVMATDHVELQRRLLQCAGAMEPPPCQEISSWVVQAIRPAAGGTRTDAILFGICETHKPTWMYVVGALGYREGFVIEWSALGEVVADMKRVGWIA
jgi:hypothetical protein